MLMESLRGKKFVEDMEIQLGPLSNEGSLEEKVRLEKE